MCALSLKNETLDSALSEIDENNGFDGRFEMKRVRYNTNNGEITGW